MPETLYITKKACLNRQVFIANCAIDEHAEFDMKLIAERAGVGPISLGLSLFFYIRSMILFGLFMKEFASARTFWFAAKWGSHAPALWWYESVLEQLQTTLPSSHSHSYSVVIMPSFEALFVHGCLPAYCGSNNSTVSFRLLHFSVLFVQ